MYLYSFTYLSAKIFLFNKKKKKSKKRNENENDTSNSSSFLMQTEMRMELTEVSIMTFSLAFLEMNTVLPSNSLDERASTSGLLWRSMICEAKFSMHMAAVIVALMQLVYGLIEVAYT